MSESSDGTARALRALERHLELERSFGAAELPAALSALPQAPPAPAPPTPAETPLQGHEPAATRAQTAEPAAPAAERPRPTNPPAGTPDDVESARGALSAMAREVDACTRCEISGSRRCSVFGEGHPRARLMFIGEAPGADEDRTGRPFVGKAGQLLTKIIQAIHLDRSEVFIANVLKCRPPGNRTPRPDEVDNCFSYLAAQISVIQPEIICTLGAPATKTLLRTDRGIRQLRGVVHHYEGIPVVPTYHPAYLLRNPAEKIPVWHDIQLVEKMLGAGGE